MTVTVVTSEALGVIAFGPYIELATDGQRVLLRGPSLSATWPKPTPAEASAYDDGLPEIRLTVREALRVATGEVVDTRTHLDEPVRVRLYTAVELMLANRRARGDIPADQIPEPLGRERAAELVAPAMISARDRRLLLEKFGDEHLERWRHHENGKGRAG